MRITALRTYLVPPRWLFLKVETDEGVSGWGEPVLEGHAEALQAEIGALADVLIGRDPRLIEDTWQMIYRAGCYRGGPVLMSALAGVDTALWDVKGRWLGQPVHALLGGPVRDRVRSYRWIVGDRPRATQDLIAGAEALIALGFDACKFNVCEEMQPIDSFARVDAVIRRLFALREAVGSRLDLALDFHGRVHLPMARVLLKEIEPIRPLFVEDAVAAQAVEEAEGLSRLTSIPLCFGERMHGRAEWKRLFERRIAQVVNPDPAHVGGISETVRIGHWAEAYDVALAPHCPLGPIALAACLQVDAVCHNAVIQEQSLGIHYNAGGDLESYLRPGGGFTLEGNSLLVPTGPGLGIEVDEERVREAARQGHRWRPPAWRHADGSVAEW